MRLLILAASLMSAAPFAAFGQQNSVADDPCARYQWDVSQERALFAAPASPVTAGKDGQSAPRIETNRAYRVLLAPAGQVVLPTAPGRASPVEGRYSGVLAIAVPVAGSYRVSVDLPLWIDVVADARLVSPTDYEAERGCDAPRKIVQFLLNSNERLILQLSGSSEAAARVAVVRTSGG